MSEQPPNRPDLYIVSIQDKSLYGEPDVALAVVEAPLADDACRAAWPTIEALADRGRGRCVPHAHHLELGRFYRLGALVRLPHDQNALQGLPLDHLPDAAVDRLLAERDRAEEQRDRLTHLLRGAILVIERCGQDASAFRSCLDGALSTAIQSAQSAQITARPQRVAFRPERVSAAGTSGGADEGIAVKQPNNTVRKTQDAIAFAYGVSREFGEAAVIKMCRLVEDHKLDYNGCRFEIPHWWRWTVHLAGALIIQRNRTRDGIACAPPPVEMP